MPVLLFLTLILRATRRPVPTDLSLPTLCFPDPILLAPPRSFSRSSIMRAAAQVAAEMAALQAAEMEQQDQRRYGGNTMTSEDIRFMQAVRASEQVDNSSQHYGNSYAVDNVDPNQLLQAIMAQQQQEMRGHQRQQQSVFPPLIQQRPQEHYITIANNGRSKYMYLCIFIVVMRMENKLSHTQYQ